ncbi:MAG: fimbrial protein [Pseudomonadota bacterium]|uniref:fimbrial protein n=1 Tax=Providencia TaxID=586 RepID=UPI0024B12F30
MNTQNRQVSRGALLFLLTLFPFCSVLASTSTILNFEANIVKVACELSVSQSQIKFDTVMTNEIKPQTLIRTRDFNLNISQCNTLDGQDNIAPKLKVSGSGLSTLDGKWLFRTEDSPIKNMGFLLYQNETSPTYSDSSLNNNSIIDYHQTYKISTLNLDTKFYAMMACGDSETCDKAKTETGILKAVVSFDLLYD